MDKVDEALSDLEMTIRLSGERGKAAEQAFTQRGLIMMLRGNEDAALEDFKVWIHKFHYSWQAWLIELHHFFFCGIFLPTMNVLLL